MAVDWIGNIALQYNEKNPLKFQLLSHLSDKV
jgi:hypothetical protein